MLACRSVRLSAAAFRIPGSLGFRVKEPRGDVTLTFRRHRFSPLRGPEQPRAHLETRIPELPRVPDRDASAAFVTADWRHPNRVTARLLLDASRAHSRGGARSRSVLFTGTTFSMQSRAASTNTATKKSEADDNKEFVHELQEASTTSTTEKSPEDKPEPQEGKLNKTQQLKKVFKEYGAVGVSFHIGISLVSLGMFYLLISSGIDLAAILCKLGFSEAVVQSTMVAGTSAFVLAYAVHKLFAPVRISITLVSVPIIVRFLRKTGLFKPPTPAP
ncbi:protein FAM210B, mitochondrial [Austrofundulus limnaeus]|uniref:Protein FAM210B, mitochondrial n=1 Tax=Austrofundulus limnaeus TaxID=52670 RepID=A0A2I4AXJ6_AUSLI|nr:PREDICTED: protein FAM210B [Austrofundulus limnaeus]